MPTFTKLSYCFGDQHPSDSALLEFLSQHKWSMDLFFMNKLHIPSKKYCFLIVSSAIFHCSWLLLFLCCYFKITYKNSLH